MSTVFPPDVLRHQGESIIPLHEQTIACDHCGIVALDTPAFGWQRWHSEDGALMHHCPQAVQYNEYIATGLVHMKAPDEAIQYEYWPQPNVFYLVNHDTKQALGPYIGRDLAIEALNNDLGAEERSGTAVLNDAEYHTYCEEVAR